MFFLTFLPQFVSASDPHAGAKLMFLGLYFIVLAVPICSLLILLAERFTAAIRRSPQGDARDRLSVRRPDGRVRGQASVRAGGLKRERGRIEALKSCAREIALEVPGAARAPCDPQAVNALMLPRQGRSRSRLRAWPERGVSLSAIVRHKPAWVLARPLDLARSSRRSLRAPTLLPPFGPVGHPT